jgi:uncharacterized protein
MRSIWGLLVPGILLFVGTVAQSQAASFDCRKAANTVEITICADELIGRLDERMATAYRNARERSSDSGALVAEQRAWLRERNACSTKTCIERLYEQRISHLDLANESVSAIPPQVAATLPTSITPDASKEPGDEELDASVERIDVATPTPAIAPAEQQPAAILLETSPAAEDAGMPVPANMIPAAVEEAPSPAAPNPNSELASAPHNNVSALQTQADAQPDRSGVEWWRDYLPRPNERLEDTYRRHPTFYNWFAGYVLVSGLFGLALVRPPLIRWYRSQFWFVRGAGPVDILLKQIWFRLGFELFTYVLACAVGAVGGWLFIFLRHRGRPTDTIHPSVAMTGLD